MGLICLFLALLIIAPIRLSINMVSMITSIQSTRMKYYINAMSLPVDTQLTQGRLLHNTIGANINANHTHEICYECNQDVASTTTIEYPVRLVNESHVPRILRHSLLQD